MITAFGAMSLGPRTQLPPPVEKTAMNPKYHRQRYSSSESAVNIHLFNHSTAAFDERLEVIFISRGGMNIPLSHQDQSGKTEMSLVALFH